MSVRSQTRRTPSRHPFQCGGSAEFIDLAGFHFELVRPDYVWDTVEYTLTYGELSARLKIIGIDSVAYGLESNMDLVHFVWYNIEQFSYTRNSITLLPLTTIFTIVLRRSTSLITGVRATVVVIRTVALCADLRTLRSFVPSPTTAYYPAGHVDALSADRKLPPWQLPPLISCFDSHSICN